MSVKTKLSWTDRAALLAGTGMILHSRLLLRAGLRTPIDGYRHGAGLVLRQPPARFVLSAFGLKVWSDVPAASPATVEGTHEHLAARLSAFLAREVDSHFRIIQSALQDRPECCDDSSHTLAFEDWISGPERFIRPDRWNVEQNSQSLLNIVCRVSPSGCADLWMRVNHVGADGLPMQEMLSRLQAAWETDPVIYPTPEEFAHLEHPRPCEGGEPRKLAESQMFFDFGPLLAWRKKQNAIMRDQLTLAAAILWQLARQERWSTLHMATTVAVPEIRGLPRGVGMVVLRPADYFSKADGLAKYAREFNRQMRLTQTRLSPAFKNLEAAAHIPPRMTAQVLRHALDGGQAFGSIGLTMLREASVFGVPLGDFGHDNGFMAIGSVNLPTADGRQVGCVTFKGPMQKIREYPTAFASSLLTPSAQAADR